MRHVSNMFCADLPSSFSICLSDNGDVYSMGRLTSLHDLSYSKKVIIPSSKNIQSIHSSQSHTICLDVNGQVFTFGKNDYGELGIITTSFFTEALNSFKTWYRSKDTLIKEFHSVDLPPCKQVSCGTNFSVCISEEGELFFFGSLGEILLEDKVGTLMYNFPHKVLPLKNVDFAECGELHIVIKTFDNEIFVWGDNARGQLGIGSTQKQDSPFKCANWPSNVIDVKCGMFHTLVLTSNNEVYSCGSSSLGQTGLQVGYHFAILHKIETLSNIIRIGCGYFHSMCIDGNNDLYVFGDNRNGQLGLGDKKHRYKPIKHPSLSNIIDTN